MQIHRDIEMYQSLFEATAHKHVPAETDTKSTTVQQQRNGVFYVARGEIL
jgi:hypothetical protein